MAKKKKLTPEQTVRKALHRYSISGKPIYIGIDPGAQGAVGLVIDKYAYAFSLPTVKVKRGKGNKTEFVLGTIDDLFKLIVKSVTRRAHVIVERPLVRVSGWQVKNKFGKKRTAGVGGMFSAQRQGENFGMWPLFLVSVGLGHPKIAIPHVWKKKMGITKNKAKSIRVALKLFPNLNLPLKKDHDKAEAILMAEYLRRTHRG